MEEFETVLMTTFQETDEYIAKKSLTEANQLIEKIMQSQQYTEEELRHIMKLYLDAFWVFPEYRAKYSNTIHQIGRDLEEQFECKYTYSDEKHAYYISCPAVLLHYDFGFSLRGTEKYKCSICGNPVTDCEHITGDFYDDIICNNINGRCNICNKTECDHIVNKKYNQVMAIKNVYDMNIITFDLVKNPEMKFARISKKYLKEDDIAEFLPPEEKKEFKFGSSHLFCHHCSQCQGYQPNLLDGLIRNKDV